MAYLVYIADESPELVEQISEQLAQAGSSTKVFYSFADLQSNSEKTLPDLVLLNHSLLTNGDTGTELFSKVPAIVYAGAIDIEKGLDLYEHGVKRLVIEPENLAAHASAAARMILFRRDVLRRSRQASVTYGTLQTFSMREVLQNALLEKKNLIIKIRHKEGDIKIRTFQGHIVNAFALNLSSEEAVLKAMQFPTGSFVIRGYYKLDEYSPVSSSTLAILAEAKFEQNEMRRFLNAFANGSSNPEFQVVTSKKGKPLPPEKTEALALIEEHRAFQSIILNSRMSVLKTVRELSSLCTRGYIKLTGEGEVVETFQQPDIDYVRERLLPEGSRGGNLVILGMPSTGRSELISTFAGKEKGAIKSVRSVDFVRINLQSDLALTIFGISLEENLLSILEKISQSMVACIFLVDYTHKDQFEFLNYLFNRIVQIYPVPFVVGLTNVTGNPEQALKTVRKQFTLPENIQFVTVQADSFGDVRKLVYGLRQVEAEIEEEN